MIPGLSLATLTLVDALLSVIGIAAGLVVMERLLRTRALGLTNAVFLIATILTSATGFLFPSKSFGAAHMVGVFSLVLLALAAIALYYGNLIGPWRWIYVVTAAMALYFNVVAGVVQAFMKVGRLRMLAPTQTEPPFALTQVAILLFFLVVAAFAVRRCRPPTA